MQHVPVREVDVDGPLQLQICSLDYSSFVGRIGIGRVNRGRIRSGQQVLMVAGPNGETVTRKINQVLIFSGLEKEVVEEADAGNIAVSYTHLTLPTILLV